MQHNSCQIYFFFENSSFFRDFNFFCSSILFVNHELWPHFPCGRVIIPRICLRWLRIIWQPSLLEPLVSLAVLSLVYLATCRWSHWRHKSSGQSIANVYAPIGGVLNTVRLSISYCLPIHILFSRIIKLIDIRVKSIITFFEIIYHHNNCSTNNFNHK